MSSHLSPSASSGASPMTDLSAVPAIEAEIARTEERAARWAAFSSAGAIDARIAAWLAMVAPRIPGVCAISVFRRGNSPDGHARLGHWRDPGATIASDDEFVASADRAFAGGVSLIRSVGSAFHLLACPDGESGHAVVVECHDVQPPDLRAAFEELRWGAGWLAASVARQEGSDDAVVARRAGGAVEIMQAVVTERDVVAVAGALSAQLSTHLPDALVTVAVWRRNVLSLAARAGKPSDDDATLDDVREALVRAALSSRRSLRCPVLAATTPTATDAVPATGEVRACVQLLDAGGTQAAGAVLCERRDGSPFSNDELALIETVAQLAAPLVELSPVTRQAPVTRERRVLVGLFGPVRFKWKLALIVLLALVLASIGATGDYDAPVDAIVEAAPARHLPAPFDGRIADVQVRAGTIVRRGQLLARMDSAEVQQERARIVAERDKLVQAARAEPAEGEAKKDDSGAAQRDLEARIVALDERLGRTQVVSPVDGVITGGAAVQANRPRVAATDDLFVIAPLDGLRLLLRAVPADAELLREGQTGQVTTGADGAIVPFVVKRIARGDGPDGEVRIEAQPQGEAASSLQPGAPVQGHVAVGTQKLVWILWRHLEHRARVTH
jgi:hypothetical protein